jgi:hypothetical protein
LALEDKTFSHHQIYEQVQASKAQVKVQVQLQLQSQVLEQA